MRRDELYLNDIVEAADHIAAFLGEADFEGFGKSELVRSAVVQKLAIIGEAAARISDELRGQYPQIPWPQIVAFQTFSSMHILGLTGMKSGKQPGLTAPICADESPPFSQQNSAGRQETAVIEEDFL